MAVIENVTFRLAAGASRDEFLACDQSWQTELIPNRPGYLRRTTACSDDGQWLVATLWATVDDADAFHSDARSSEVGRRLYALVDEASIERHVFTTLD